MVESNSRSEQESIKPSIDFTKYGYEKDAPLTKLLEGRLERAGAKRVVEVATELFQPNLAAYSARAISKDEFESGDAEVVNEFKKGTFIPKDDNIVALLISLDFAQRMRDTDQPKEKMLAVFTPTAPEYKGLANSLQVPPEKLGVVHEKLLEKVAKWNELYAKSRSVANKPGGGLPYGPKFKQG